MVVPPLPLVAVTAKVNVGTGLTVTVALPLRSAGMAVQFASIKVARVYTVVPTGVTFTVIVGADPKNGVPSDKVPLMAPLPVTVNVNAVVVDCPLQ